MRSVSTRSGRIPGMAANCWAEQSTSERLPDYSPSYVQMCGQREASGRWKRWLPANRHSLPGPHRQSTFHIVTEVENGIFQNRSKNWCRRGRWNDRSGRRWACRRPRRFCDRRERRSRREQHVAHCLRCRRSPASDNGGCCFVATSERNDCAKSAHAAAVSEAHASTTPVSLR